MDLQNLYIRITGFSRRGALILLLVLLGGLAGGGLPTAAAGIQDAPELETLRTHELYLPQMLDVYPPKPPVLLGIYPTDYWQPMVSDGIKKEFHSLESWSGERISLAGVFHSFDQSNTVTNMLPLIWDAGYTPFVNLYTSATLTQINGGKIDGQIRAWARAFKNYAAGGQRFAFLLPLWEMNGDWVPYKGTPGAFIPAYRRILDIFKQEGVPDESVAWVFGPNGPSLPSKAFEDYYPGDAYVDAVGFSSYNFGYTPKMSAPVWLTPQQTFRRYIDRMQALAPTKPLFIAQTGTTAYTETGFNHSAKDDWLRVAYSYLAARRVAGILYYNDDVQQGNLYLEWAIYEQGRTAYQGYIDGVADPAYKYVSPAEVRNRYR